MVSYNTLNAFAKSSFPGGVMTSDPTINHDKDSGWAVGDVVISTATGSPVAFMAISVASGAAVWRAIDFAGAGTLVGRLIGANMNVSTDQAIPLLVPAAVKIRPTKITVTNASISLSTAAGGVYTAASKGGTAIVAAGQLYSALTAAAKAVDLTLANSDVLTNPTQLFLSLTTPQGAAATADVFVFGDVLA